MDWPERQKAGFALAATACGDRGATKALHGLSAAIAGPVSGLAQRLGADEPNARRRWVRAVLASRVERSEISAVQGDRPARALALLGASVDKQLGRAWLAGAALPRAGYVAEPRLLALLLKLAARPSRPSGHGHAWRA